jgi:hypothetical protein
MGTATFGVVIAAFSRPNLKFHFRSFCSVFIFTSGVDVKRAIEKTMNRSGNNHHPAFAGYEMLPQEADGPSFVMVTPKPDVPVK